MKIRRIRLVLFQIEVRNGPSLFLSCVSSLWTPHALPERRHAFKKKKTTQLKPFEKKKETPKNQLKHVAREQDMKISDLCPSLRLPSVTVPVCPHPLAPSPSRRASHLVPGSSKYLHSHLKAESLGCGRGDLVRPT